jgi:uncharacterized protein (DUF1697 family)
MTAFVALLRAINVGGTGKLPMSELAELCRAAGFADVRTYIQSGNVVFTSKLSELAVKKKLEALLAKKLGKPVGVMVRTADELRAALKSNPFKQAPPNRVLVLFLDEPPARAAFASLTGPDGEEVKLKGREVFVHYPNGQGKSKLKLPLVNLGTGRNINTVSKLAEMAAELE